MHSGLWLALACVLGSTALGCDAVGDEETEESSDELNRGRFPFGGGGFNFGGGQGQGQVVAGPDGLYTTTVRANGSGCPKGSWNAGISADGKTFTITFSQYDTRVGPGQAVDMKNCSIDVSLVGTKNLTFAIGAFHYQGYVALDSASMKATQRATYSFNPIGFIAGFIPPGQGGGFADAFAGIGGVQSENAMSGPIDRSFLYTDEVGIEKWSPCAPLANLHIATELKLQNNRGRTGQGYLNNSTVDGNLSFAWKLDWKECVPPPPPPNQPPAPDWGGGGGG